MPVMPQLTVNPYVMGTFKHHFVQEYNKVAAKKVGQDVSLPVVLAESFAILLDLINQDQDNDDVAVSIIGAEDGNAKKA